MEQSLQSYLEAKLRSAKQLKRSVAAEVTFGLRSKNCAGVGICEVKMLPTTNINNRRKCQHTAVELQVTHNVGIKMLFKKTNLCKNIQRELFSNESLILKEGFALPDSIVNQWALPYKFIPAGQYLLLESVASYIVFFKVIQ